MCPMNLIRISISHSHDSISRRAKELWLQSGEPDGQDLAIWLQAERELNGRPIDPLHTIDQEQLQECLDSFGYQTRSRGPTALDLT